MTWLVQYRIAFLLVIASLAYNYSYAQNLPTIKILKEKVETAESDENHFLATMALCRPYYDYLLDSLDDYPPYLKEHLDRAISWSDQEGDETHKALVLEHKFNHQYYSREDIYRTIVAANKMLDEVDHLSLWSRDIFFHNIGHLYQRIGRYEEMIDVVERRFEVQKTINLEADSSPYFGDLAIIYMDLKDYDKSLLNFKKSAYHYGRQKNFVRKSSIYNNIGLLCVEFNMKDSALVWYQAALNELTLADVEDNHFDPEYRVHFRNMIRSNLASVNDDYLSQEERFILHKGLVKSSKKVYEIHGVFGAYFALAQSYYNLNNYLIADQYLDSAYETALNWDNPNRQIEVIKQKANIAFINSNIALGNSFFEKANYMTDSLKSVDSQMKAIAAAAFLEAREKDEELAQSKETILETKNEAQNEKHNRQILSFILIGIVIILGIFAYFLKDSKKSSAIIKEKKKQVEEALAEKEVLLKEIHHRVKNNMQIISGLLELQAYETDDAEVSRLMNEGKSRIETMALIHQMLYSNSNLSTINFKEYIKNLSFQTINAYQNGNKIELEFDMIEVDIDIDIAMTLGLMTHELLNNSLKYAFDHTDGKISISLNSPLKDEYTLIIKDDGKGMPKGFKLEDSESLGLRLVQMLSHDIRGKVLFSNEDGAKCSITWKNN